ncbi:MAG TPA: lipopolysaccharide biosynthesis protein, partial [Allocoleopsis sp.]
MNLKQKAFKGIIWSAIESWGRQAISTIIFFVLARLLTPEAFGLIALSSVFIAFIQIFLDQGFSQAIVQREKVEPEHLDTAFWTNITISTLLTLTSITFADEIALLFKEPALASILRWLSLNFILISLSSVQEAVLARQFAFKALATRSLIAIVVGGSIGLGMAISGYGVWSLVAYQLVNASVRVLVLWWSSDWRPGFKVSLLHFKQLFSFGINIVGNNCLSFLDRRSDDFLIGFFLGSVALGYYSIAYKVLLTTTELLMGFVNKVAMPVFSRLQDNPERLRQAFYRSTQLTSLIAFPCFIGIALSAPEI